MRREIVSDKKCSKWRKGDPEEVDPKKEIFSVDPHRTRVFTGRSDRPSNPHAQLKIVNPAGKLPLNRGNSAAAAKRLANMSFLSQQVPDSDTLRRRNHWFCCRAGCSLGTCTNPIGGFHVANGCVLYGRMSQPASFSGDARRDPRTSSDQSWQGLSACGGCHGSARRRSRHGQPRGKREAGLPRGLRHRNQTGKCRHRQ